MAGTYPGAFPRGAGCGHGRPTSSAGPSREKVGNAAADAIGLGRRGELCRLDGETFIDGPVDPASHAAQGRCDRFLGVARDALGERERLFDERCVRDDSIDETDARRLVRVDRFRREDQPIGRQRARWGPTCATAPVLALA